MVITIKKGDSKKEIDAALKRLNKKKRPSDLIQFYGKIKGKFGDGLEWQKQVRNEWD